jgi:hypothetical protein
MCKYPALKEVALDTSAPSHDIAETFRKYFAKRESDRADLFRVVDNKP